MISGKLFGIILLNLTVDGLGDMEGTTGLPMEDSTGPPMEGSGLPMEDYEDSTPFQCNDQNQPGGSDKQSSKARSKSVLNSPLRYKYCSKYYKFDNNKIDMYILRTHIPYKSRVLTRLV